MAHKARSRFGHAIVGIIVLAILILFLVVYFSAHAKLGRQLCADAAKYGYPSWYVDHSPKGKIVYAFSGYSGTTEDVVIDGVIHYNYREATAEELSNRFIQNKVYFVYSSDAISARQIQSFKDDSFWDEYVSSGLTIKC